MKKKNHFMIQFYVKCNIFHTKYIPYPSSHLNLALHIWQVCLGDLKLVMQYVTSEDSYHMIFMFQFKLLKNQLNKFKLIWYMLYYTLSHQMDFKQLCMHQFQVALILLRDWQPWLGTYTSCPPADQWHLPLGSCWCHMESIAQ